MRGIRWASARPVVTVVLAAACVIAVGGWLYQTGSILRSWSWGWTAVSLAGLTGLLWPGLGVWRWLKRPEEQVDSMREAVGRSDGLDLKDRLVLQKDLLQTKTAARGVLIQQASAGATRRIAATSASPPNSGSTNRRRSR